MKSSIKLLAVLALALAAFGQHSTAYAGGNFKFRGDTADAFFSTFDGCVFTDVFVFASDNVNQSTPGPAGSSSGANLFIARYDACTDTQLLAADGFAWLAPSDFQVGGKLSSASLNANVGMFDYVSGTPFDVSVNLTWTGNGPIVRQSSNSHFSSPGCKVNSRFRGTFRGAEASGTVSDGVTNYTPDPTGGTIASVRGGDLFIGCN